MTTTPTTLDTAVVRTYETFTIRWADGGSISGYTSQDEAAAHLRFACRDGYVVRRTFDQVILPDMRSMYRPGVAERPATVDEAASGRPSPHPAYIKLDADGLWHMGCPCGWRPEVGFLGCKMAGEVAEYHERNAEPVPAEQTVCAVDSTDPF